MTPFEINFILWCCVGMLGIISAVGGLIVKFLIQGHKTLMEIKTLNATELVRREYMELRIHELKLEFEKLKKAA